MIILVDLKLTLYSHYALFKPELRSKPTSKAESMSLFSVKVHDCPTKKGRLKDISKSLQFIPLDQFLFRYDEFLRTAFLFIEDVDRLLMLFLGGYLYDYSIISDSLRILKRTYAYASKTRNLLTIIGNEELTWNLMKNNEVLFRSLEKLALYRSWFEFDRIVVDPRVYTSIRAKFENAWTGTYHGVQPFLHVPLRLAPHCQCISFSVDQDDCLQKEVSVSSSNTAHPTNREISSIKDSFQIARTNWMKIIEDKQTFQAQRTCDEISSSSSSSSLGPSDIADKRVFSYTDIITNHDQKSKDENKNHDYTVPSFSVLGKIAFPFKGQLALILLLFSNVCVSNTNASSDVKRVIGAFPTLSTGSCSRESYFNRSCPPRSNFDMLMKLCDYQCKPGYQPRCITVENGSVYICPSSNLTCSPGVRWLPFLTDNNLTHVTIMQEECPAGSFQSTNSNCFDACKDKHKDTSNLPKELLIYSMGDTKSPSIVYCNFKENYFNVNGDFLIDLNSFMEHDRYFCSNIEYVPNRCPKNMQILPNGKCVTPCEEGSEIDVYANFTCKRSIVPIQVTSSTARTPPTTAITSSPKTSTTTDDKDKVQIDENDTSTEKDSTVVKIVIGVIGILLILALLALAIFIYCYCKKEKNFKKGGPAMDVEDQQLEGSDRSSVEKAASYIVHNETHAENLVQTGENCTVHVHLHNACSSFSANQSNQENQSSEDDNTDGRNVAQNVKPIVRFIKDADEDDDLDSRSTDGTETTALLISEGRKPNNKKLTASPYGSQDNEDPADGIIDSNITDPLLTSGYNDNENTEIKSILIDNTYSGSLNTNTDQTYSESEDNSTDITQIKTQNTDTSSNSSDGKLILNNNNFNILNNEHDSNATERKIVYHENGISNTMGTPKMPLLKDIESNDESSETDNESADTASASTDSNDRMANLKEPHELCNKSINTDDNTKIKELFDPCENSTTDRYGPESESHLRSHLPANTGDNAYMEMQKEYDGDFGHTRVISSSLSDQRLSVSDRSLEGQVSSRRSYDE